MESTPTFQHAIMNPSPLLVGSRQSSVDASTKGTHSRGAPKDANDQVDEENCCPNLTWISGDYNSLPEVPMFYPIERTSTVVSCCDPRAIANRIVDCLYQLSITAKCNSQEALFAEALDHTMFFIRLYKNNNINEKGVLIELQRVNGDSFNFIRYARVILAAARGEAIDTKRAICRSASLEYIPSCKLSEQSTRGDTAYLTHVEELIQKDRSDTSMLGLDSLLLLTSIRSQVSVSVSEAVLNGDGHSSIRDFILQCIQCPHSTLSPEENAFDYESRQCDTMHNTALAVLANALQTASDAEQLNPSDILLESEKWMGHSGIVDALLYEMSNANDRPHDAYQATRCLHALLESSEVMKRVLIERGLFSALKDSRDVGRRRHSLLARECYAALAFA